MNEDTGRPAFFKMRLDELATLASGLYDLTQRQHETIEQLRLDNKDLSKINRELLKGNQDDWK